MKLKSYSAVTGQGPYLQVNEDGQDYDLNSNLFMVLDGFGGSGVGDRYVQKLKEYLKTFYVRVVVDKDATMPFYFSQKYLVEGNALINSMLYSHKLLFQENAKAEISRRGGASAMLAAFSENIITFASVGNCMGYLARHGKLSKIMIEDSFKLLSLDEFRPYYQTMPLSAFGMFPDLHFQIKELRPIEGDLILMMTDGAYSRIEEEELSFIVMNAKESPQTKISSIFELANSRGNLDNQTALILQF